jgi:hypothetical protein
VGGAVRAAGAQAIVTKLDESVEAVQAPRTAGRKPFTSHPRSTALRPRHWRRSPAPSWIRPTSTPWNRMGPGAHDPIGRRTDPGGPVKPFNAQILLERVEHALRVDDAKRAIRNARGADTARLALLTTREAQVVDLVTGGCANVEIARRLGLSQKTEELHRALPAGSPQVLAPEGEPATVVLGVVSGARTRAFSRASSPDCRCTP